MNPIRRFLWNKEGKIRASWRVLIPILLAIVIIRGAWEIGLLTALPSVFVEIMGMVLAIVIVLWVGSRWIDHRPIKDYGLDIDRHWWTDLVWGFCIGVFVVGLAWIINIGLGWSTLDSTFSGAVGPFAIVFPIILVVIILTSLWEEIVFRGVFITNATEGLNKIGVSSYSSVISAWMLSTVAFTSMHLIFPDPLIPAGVPLFVMIVVWTVGGATLGLAYVLTGSLATPIGLHTAYNLMRTVVIGDAAPPLDEFPAFLRLEMDFPGLWETMRGFEFPMYFVVIVAIILWAYLIQGEISIDKSLLK